MTPIQPNNHPSPSAAFVVSKPNREHDGLLHFCDPLNVWQADHQQDVAAAVSRVEAEQRRGLYVLGFIRYEAGPAFDPAIKSHDFTQGPLVWFASFDRSSDSPAVFSDGSISQPTIRVPQSEYEKKVRLALDHIRAGDIYQVNYTVRADVEIMGDPYDVWRELLRAVPVPHAAFIDTGDAQFLSLSPELFLKRTGNLIETMPMKGTAPRRPSWEEDEQMRIALEASEKDCAENIMIVDLMRNDLSRICRAGSVHVSELCHAYRFPTVHQMTSTVRGELEDGVSLFDIFKATFPPGSVTGAPKIRATEIIRDLEPNPRGIYCGSMCIFFPNGDFTCNVAIRTLESSYSPPFTGGQGGGSSFHPSSLIPHPFLLGLGSGIVIDSDPASEWNETLVKSQFSQAKPHEFGLFESFRYVSHPLTASDSISPPFTGNSGDSPPFTGGQGGGSSGAFQNLHSHLRRLKNSCDYFSRPFPVRSILNTLRDLKSTLGDSPHRIRLELSREGDITTRLIDENLNWPPEGLIVLVADERLNPDDPRLYHKTTARQEKYNALKLAQKQGAHEVLFLNTRGELCEGAISNIMLHINGEWLTPALSCGLLPGVWRERQLKSCRAREAILTLDDLHQADEILMGNSVRGEARVLCMLPSANSPGSSESK